MSLVSSVGNLLGVDGGGATGTLEKALQDVRDVKVPSVQDLQVILSKMVNAGTLTADQAQTFLQNPSAFNDVVLPTLPQETQTQVMSQLMGMANNGGLNPALESQTQHIMNDLNTQERGQNEAIEQQQAARGTLTGGLDMAAKLVANQNAVTNANQRAGDVAGNAYQAALGELSGAAGIGSNLQNQNWSQAAQKAAAADAISKFNASQAQGVENANVADRNSAKSYNTTNAQRISDSNTGISNEQEVRNKQAPQTVFQDALSKASTALGGANSLAAQQEKVNERQGVLAGNILGAAGGQVGNVFSQGSGLSSSGTSSADGIGQAGGPMSMLSAAPLALADGGVVPDVINTVPEESAADSAKKWAKDFFDPAVHDTKSPTPTGGFGLQTGVPNITPLLLARAAKNPTTNGLLEKALNQARHHGYSCGGEVQNFKAGGMVPGKPVVPGDSPLNDTVTAKVSPGELVIPRTTTQGLLERMRQHGKPSIHPKDVATVLQALSHVRGPEGAI